MYTSIVESLHYDNHPCEAGHHLALEVTFSISNIFLNTAKKLSYSNVLYNVGSICINVPVNLEFTEVGLTSNSQGGGTLRVSYLRRLRLFFWVQNFQFQYILGFSEKLIFFWGMKVL